MLSKKNKQYQIIRTYKYLSSKQIEERTKEIKDILCTALQCTETQRATAKMAEKAVKAVLNFRFKRIWDRVLEMQKSSKK